MIHMLILGFLIASALSRIALRRSLHSKILIEESRTTDEITLNFEDNYYDLKLLVGGTDNHIFQIKPRDPTQFKSHNILLKAMRLDQQFYPTCFNDDGCFDATSEVRFSNEVSDIESFVYLHEAFGGNLRLILESQNCLNCESILDNLPHDTSLIDTQFMVLERVEGESLHSVLNNDKLIPILKPTFILSVIVQVLSQMELASLQKQYYHLDLHSKNILFANAIDPEKCQPDDKIDSLESYNQNFEFDLKFVDRSRLVRVPKIWTCDERIRLIDYGQSTILVPQSSSNKFEHLKVHTASMRFAFQFIFADIKCSLWHYWNWRFRKDPTQRLAKDTILYMFMTIFGIENIQKTKTEIRKICKPSHVKNQLELQKNWSDMKLEKAIPHLSCDNKCLVSFWKVLKNYLTDFVF